MIIIILNAEYTHTYIYLCMCVCVNCFLFRRWSIIWRARWRNKCGSRRSATASTARTPRMWWTGARWRRCAYFLATELNVIPIQGATSLTNNRVKLILSDVSASQITNDDLTLGNKFQWNRNQDKEVFISKYMHSKMSSATISALLSLG